MQEDDEKVIPQYPGDFRIVLCLLSRLLVISNYHFRIFKLQFVDNMHTCMMELVAFVVIARELALSLRET